jgi:hypothetical protein
VLWLLGISASAMAGDTLDDGRRWKDTGRLYVYTLFGQAFLLDDDAAPGVELDTPAPTRSSGSASATTSPTTGVWSCNSRVPRST